MKPARTDGNNVSTVMAYDQATGAPVGISSGIGQSSSVQQMTYAWDGFGNLTERLDANQSNLYETLTYDDLNRLSTSAEGEWGTDHGFVIFCVFHVMPTTDFMAGQPVESGSTASTE